MGLLDGRVVVLSGAGRGIGRGEAIELARQGASVVVNDVDAEAAAAVAAEIADSGATAIAHVGDCSEVEAAQSLVDQAVATFGRLDAVVNNAGIVRDRTLAKMTPEEWDAVIAVHLRGHYALTHAASGGAIKLSNRRRPAQPDFGAFTGGFHFQLAATLYHQEARSLQHFLDFAIVVCGIVVKQEQFLRPGLQRERNDAAQGAVSPADVLLIFLVGVLGVENQDVRIFQKLD
jgi:NAD(P)-dependent dehydrogenase (short-subunit alcohol dehydrogenase family)